MVVMIAFGQIDFFESLTCEQLELYMTDDIRGKYPLETPFAPSQIGNLDEQYNLRCLT